MLQPVHHYLSREARPVVFVLTAFVLAVYFFIGAGPGATALVPALIIVFLMRDPVCKVPSQPLGVVSPASGRILSVENMQDPFLERPSVRIRMRNGILNVHTLRSPAEGKIIRRWITGKPDWIGRRVRSFHMRTDEDDDLVLSMVIGPMAPLVKLNFITGERAGQGEVRGFLYLTGLIDIYLADDSRVAVKPGDRVRSGSTLLGEFTHDHD